MKIQIQNRFDGVQVTKIQTPKGILSFFKDEWGFNDILITLNVFKRDININTQNDAQLQSIIRDFLK